MRIESLHIDGFGHFADARFGPFDDGITVLYGPNEAGKTTLLAFIRTMLFGFPARLQGEHYPPLNGGRHGGRITLLDDSGVRYVVERYGGVRGGTVTITTSHGRQALDDGMLRRLLGGSTQKLFEAVFAFGLGELQTIESLTKAEANTQIYAAGIGAGNLPRALQHVDEQRQKLFLYRGEKQEVARILAELQPLEAELEEAKGQAARYGRLVARRAEIAAELDAANASAATRGALRNELGRLRQAWDDWVELGHLDRELEELPATQGFPADGPMRLAEAEAALRAATDAEAEAGEALAIATRETEAPVHGEALLADAEPIEAVRRGLQSFEEALRDLPRRELEAAALAETLSSALRELDAEWDEARLARLDTSTAVRDAVGRWRTRIGRAESDATEAARAAGAAEGAAADAEDTLAAATAHLNSAPVPSLTQAIIEMRRASLTEARASLHAFLRAHDRRRDLEAQAEDGPPPVPEAGSGMRSPGFILLGGGFAAAIAGIAAGSVAVLAIGLMLALAGGYLLASARARSRPPAVSAVPGSLARRLAEAREEERLALSALANASSALALPPETVPTEEQFARLEGLLAKAETSLRERAILEDARIGAAANLERARKRAQSAETAAADRRGLLATELEAWQTWLSERELPAGLLPATMADFFARAANAQLQARALAGLHDRISKIEANIAAYVTGVAAIAGRHGLALAPGDPSLAARVAESLIQRLDETRTALAERKSALRACESARHRLDLRQADTERARAGVQSTLEAGGAADAADFQARAEAHRRRRECLARREEVQTRIRKLSGGPVGYGDFTRRLATATLLELDEALTLAADETDAAVNQQLALSEEKGLTEASLRGLVSDDRTSELRARRAVLVEQLRATANDWATLTVARVLLAKAREKYEAERQPGVIRHAQQFFERVTDGRYTQLIAPLGQETITATHRDGAVRTPEQMSRGTREQLYLALRFGLIREFAARDTNLPIVIDEVLVNFDPERAELVARAFADLSDDHQVLVFTCQPSMLEIFLGAAPGAGVVRLGGARVALS